jgi:class 3 adenylate cyclase
MLVGSFELGASLDEVTRAAQLRFNLGPLMLDLSMRPPGETVDFSDFAAAEPDPDLVMRLWSALGLPDTAASPVRVTPDVPPALRYLVAMAALLGEEATLGIARVIGSSMTRLAETISGAFRVGFEMPELNTGRSHADVSGDIVVAGRDYIPPLVDSLGAFFRRHLINVSYQTWSTDPDQAAVMLERAVCFADLVGSTETLRTLSVREMADMVRRFEEQIWDLVGANGGRVVKLIGDEAMFVLEDPAHACRVGLELIDKSEYKIRVGMAFGTVLGLYGDYYGEIVNLAARLVNLAEPLTLVVSETMRERAEPTAMFEPMGPQHLKGFTDPVPAYRVSRKGTNPPG